MMTAGVAQPVARLHPLFDRRSQQVFLLVNKPGLSQVTKLSNNLVLAANMVAAFEALSPGAKAGLDSISWWS